MSNLGANQEGVLETQDTERPISEIGRPSVDIVMQPDAVRPDNPNTNVEPDGVSNASTKSGPRVFKTPYPASRRNKKKTNPDAAATMRPGNSGHQGQTPSVFVKRPVTEALPDDDDRTADPRELTEEIGRAHV